MLLSLVEIHRLPTINLQSFCLERFIYPVCSGVHHCRIILRTSSSEVYFTLCIRSFLNIHTRPHHTSQFSLFDMDPLMSRHGSFASGPSPILSSQCLCSKIGSKHSPPTHGPHGSIVQPPLLSMQLFRVTPFLPVQLCYSYMPASLTSSQHRQYHVFKFIQF